MADHSRVLEISQIKLLSRLRPLQFRPGVSSSVLFISSGFASSGAFKRDMQFTSTVDLDTGRELS